MAKQPNKPKFKLSLGRLPDFKLPVTFNMPNGEEAVLTLTVKHLTAKEVQDLYDGNTDDPKFISTLASGWDLEEEFNEDNIRELCGLYPAATISVTTAYVGALAGQRVKN